MVKKLLERIKGIFKNREVNCVSDGEECIKAEFPEAEISFHVAEDNLILQADMNIELPKECADEMLWYINDFNCNIVEGHWEIDDKNGISFRLYTDLEINKEVSDSRIETMIDRGLATAERCYKQMKQIVEGGRWKEAVDSDPINQLLKKYKIKEEKSMNMVLELVKEVLEERGLEYENVGEHIGVAFGEFVIGLLMKDDSLELRLIEAEEVNEEYRPEMLNLLNRINLITKEGHWELDLDGLICYRILVCLPKEGELEKERIDDIIVKAMQSQAVFGDGIKEVGVGMCAAEDAFDECARVLMD